MGQSTWTHTAPPLASGVGVTAVWTGRPCSIPELTRMRGRLRAALADGTLPAGADDGERLLLAVEELTSNALRHGGPPVQVTITAVGLGWLLQVSDTAIARPPAPAVGRDAAQGGMGLGLVARMSRTHGWFVDGDRKVVWAHIPYGRRGRPSPDRIDAATARARGLIRCLAVTQIQIAATLRRLALDATVEGRPERADAYRAAATRALREAERTLVPALAAPSARRRRLTCGKIVDRADSAPRPEPRRRRSARP